MFQESKFGIRIKKIRYGKDHETVLIDEYSQVKEVELGFPIRCNVEFKTVKEVINKVELGSKVNI